jgi:hypothetical protein
MRVNRNLVGVAGALLVSFHGWLLVSQYLDGQLAEPGLILRWIIAAILIASLVGLRRRGYGILSRKSVAVWVLAALLHGPTVVGHYGDALHGVALPESVATVVLQIVAASTTLVLALWLLGALLAERRDRRPRATRVVFGLHLAGALAGSFPPPFSPRPPPVA